MWCKCATNTWHMDSLSNHLVYIQNQDSWTSGKPDLEIWSEHVIFRRVGRSLLWFYVFSESTIWLLSFRPQSQSCTREPGAEQPSLPPHWHHGEHKTRWELSWSQIPFEALQKKRSQRPSWRCCHLKRSSLQMSPASPSRHISTPRWFPCPLLGGAYLCKHQKNSAEVAQPTRSRGSEQVSAMLHLNWEARYEGRG